MTPDDIKDSDVVVLQHRILVSPEKEMEGVKAEEIVKQIIDSVDVPR